jgi:hypothetical protein
MAKLKVGGANDKIRGNLIISTLSTITVVNRFLHIMQLSFFGNIVLALSLP